MIERAVQSVVEQSHPPSRLILVDDGSSDKSPSILAALAAASDRIETVLLPRNVGASSARNVGSGLARADWIAFLDSDDVWLPSAGAALIEATTPAVDVVVGHFRRSWPDGIVDPPECGWDGGNIRDALMRAGAIGPSWTLMRRSLVQKLGGFDPSYHNCEDWDFFTRAAALGARFIRIDATIAWYTYSHSGRLSHDTAQEQYNARRVLAHPFLQSGRSAA